MAMRFGIFLCALVSSGCSQTDPDDHTELMDAIERQIELPDNARPFEAYARYYARGVGGGVVAIYVVPEQFRAELTECRSSVGDCVDAPIIAANERQWLDSWLNLPVLSGSSCDFVIVFYDEQAGQIEELRCTEGLS